MKKSEIINKIHSILIFYCIFGFIFENQRKNLLLFLPTLQYQFLINDNQCILTQIENKLINTILPFLSETLFQIIFITFILLLFGEVLPKIFANNN